MQHTTESLRGQAANLLWYHWNDQVKSQLAYTDAARMLHPDPQRSLPLTSLDTLEVQLSCAANADRSNIRTVTSHLLMPEQNRT